MRLPRVRFTVRRMMVAVAVVGLVLCLSLRVDWDPYTSVGIGHTRVPIIFTVSDADSGGQLKGPRSASKTPIGWEPQSHRMS